MEEKEIKNKEGIIKKVFKKIFMIYLVFIGTLILYALFRLFLWILR